MAQLSVVSDAARKALDAEKFRANSVKRTVWVDGIRWTEYVHGQVVRFDPRLTSVKIRDRAMLHGFDQKLGDTGALEVKDFPDIRARVAEAYRRESELAEHLMSGGDDWNPGRKAAMAYVATEADVREVLKALFGDKAPSLWAGIVKMHPGADGAEVDPKAALGFLTSSKEGARVWAGIQAERRRGANAESAEDLLAKMLAAASDGEGDGQPIDGDGAPSE
jgi:hypothetical protein